MNTAIETSLLRQLYKHHRKTKGNFLNPRATKYLFSEDIHIDGKKVAVTEVGNFDGVNENDINICFTTIQQLHTDMTIEFLSLTTTDFL